MFRIYRAGEPGAVRPGILREFQRTRIRIHPRPYGTGLTSTIISGDLLLRTSNKTMLEFRLEAALSGVGRRMGRQKPGLQLSSVRRS